MFEIQETSQIETGIVNIDEITSCKSEGSCRAMRTWFIILLPQYDLKTGLGDCYAKIRREEIYEPTAGKYS